ncbi:hypothetical protein H632_c229p2 [Helicosporidium sp. ATCC 50920]|nr:hypothetical protein H632_c229p2 [Helicosporidium sp. ATCC 50920]|eukprot:KDD76428.1 hypothetical protein H632_c229p2 [Helicosporidium sp. ATCC 50920]
MQSVISPALGETGLHLVGASHGNGSDVDEASRHHTQAPTPDASDDDSLALLPKHTVVQIVGNNRTKQAYVGLRAVVKRAVGLGGWHWLVLASGEEIKLQRNALLVTEHPTGNEEDTSSSEDHSPPAPLQEPLDAPRSRPDPVRSMRPTSTRCISSGTSRTADVAEILRQSPAPQRINLGKLDMASLRRYRARYQLPEPGPDSTKDQLVLAVAEHFMSQRVNEHDVLASFLMAAKRRRAT